MKLKKFEFGNETKQDFSNFYNQSKSNPYAALEYVADVLDVQNLKAVILHSDGIYNSGRNPLYHPLLKMAPVYTVLHGDTVPEKIFRSNEFIIMKSSIAEINFRSK
ncbi:MAG: hypothetical protein IPH96_15805 [Saprospiraceae bacterium]|nr:hypothetical protein [Saprospiraceae bacterium]